MTGEGMRAVKVGVAILLGLAVVGAGAALSAVETAGPSGERVYREQCASCHGVQLGGSSGPGIGPALKGRAFSAKWAAKPGELRSEERRVGKGGRCRAARFVW